MKNPNTYQKLQELVRNTNDPKGLLQNLTNNYTPEQREKFIRFANGYGVSEEQLKNYGIK